LFWSLQKSWLPRETVLPKSAKMPLRSVMIPSSMVSEVTPGPTGMERLGPAACSQAVTCFCASARISPSCELSGSLRIVARRSAKPTSRPWSAELSAPERR
jgi:hypothetical protein